MSHRLSSLLRALYQAPGWIYRLGLGPILGRRFLALTHLGRRSGRPHTTVLEVIEFDADTTESIVMSAYGAKADWYRNIEVNSAVRVRTGRFDYLPQHRFLSPEEAQEIAEEFCARHPWEARLVPRVLPAIGAAVGDESDPAAMLGSLPIVGLRPKD
ncbi:MAG: nitroreductase family deazaflavin-dependent oxidoreductase [Acidimicrobiia bacterium]